MVNGGTNEHWVRAGLRQLRVLGLERATVCYERRGGQVWFGGRPCLNMASNDYLGLATNPRVVARAREFVATHGSGATAAPLVVGTWDCHQELERRLAQLKGYGAALLFGSGYAANLGIIPALVGRGDHVFIDRMAHASLVDGAILSRARIHRFRHNDPDHLAAVLRSASGHGRCLVVTESVFSMDGDVAPLEAVCAVAASRGAMVLVDEAHATGVFGPSGAGLVRALGLEGPVTVSMGTLSKALGAQGGFVACSEELRQWFVNRARAFMYSTGLAPAAVGAALGALELTAEHPEWGQVVLKKAERFRSRLRAAGLDTGGSQSQIVPVLVGGSERTMRLARRLLEGGVVAAAIRPPSVPAGTARLRFSVTMAHDEEQLAQAAEMVVSAAREEGII